MGDMLEVLLQCTRFPHYRARFSNREIRRLKDVSDPKQIGPDGKTIEGRMQTLCEVMADDIVNCANTCDTYLG